MLSKEFLENAAPSHCYRHPMISLAADVVCFTVHPAAGLQIALVRRSWKSPAFPGYWALPGGFLRAHEDASVEDCARRELMEEMRITATHLELVQVYSAIGRDPRPERIVSVAFLAVIPAHEIHVGPTADADVIAARWFDFDELKGIDLAFDHRQIIQDARDMLARKISFGSREDGGPDILFSFLPAKFTISKAERITAALQGARPDRGNFRKWIERYAVQTPELEPGRTRSSHLYERRTTPTDGAGHEPKVAPLALREVAKLAERLRIEAFDHFLSTIQNSTPEAVEFLEILINRYAENSRFGIKSTAVPDLRLTDRRTRRVLVTLRWQIRKQSFFCTTISDCESLSSVALEDLRTWSGSPHLSAFRLRGGSDDIHRLGAVLEIGAEKFPL